ncbi:expressed unknown protein [Seminavis robusta]|uniref:RZ-type domain-containing protein n=1 Tax=Seminavis robusta TaxID=568900 RepID=A0A9N8EQ85_9STRA|nr:expressed unknown protein [Seminavis robusta]|eukprot:Sro1497_g277580.1 n/a (328) ;mRNA; f:7875-8858
MDGVIDIGKVYQMNKEGSFVGLAPRGNDISEKVQTCPDCRSIIHSVRRYGRVLRLVELRGLERKHLARADRALEANEQRIRATLTREVQYDHAAASEQQQMLGHLNKLEDMIRKSPMNRVFQACGGSNLVESVAPPTKPLIRCFQLRALVYDHWATHFDDDNFRGAKKAYLEAMKIADGSTSLRSGAQIRLSLAKLILKYCDDVETIRKDVNAMLDWVQKESQLHAAHEIVLDAQKLKLEISQRNDTKTLRSIMSAMNKMDGYDYGGSASSHWYECPNGHPYFIGECGGAMQTARCIECGATVGGASHHLISDNRSVGGVYRDALSR